jgi:predicted RND superfamily exporter protein
VASIAGKNIKTNNNPSAILALLFNAPFTVVTQIMPSFLLAVITGASIHLLAIFYKDFAKTGDKKSALRFAMGHSGFAIVMTSLTTAAGMWSFAFSDVAPVADLGIFASASIALGQPIKTTA